MTRHLIDPQLLPGLEILPAFDLTDETLSGFRAGMADFLPPPESYARENVATEGKMIPGLNDAPDVRVLLYRPLDVSGPLPVLVFLHGGGYIFGPAESSGFASVRTADEVKCLVASVDYRLAPETKAPGQLEDCYAVLAWLNANAEELGIDRDRIAVGGESAGGGLAAAFALMVRDRAEYDLCFQLLIYPMIDDRTCLMQDVNPHVGEFVWTPGCNRFGWTSLLGEQPGGPDISPYAAAARAEDLTSLPPAYISVGALDLFLEENIDYARRLLRAGVPTELHIFPGAYHGFEMVIDADVSKDAEQERRRALARRFAFLNK